MEACRTTEYIFQSDCLHKMTKNKFELTHLMSVYKQN